MKEIALLGKTEPILAILIVLIVYTTLAIPYILTLRNTLRIVSIENREMRPGQTWLLLIPLFNVIWSFIVVKKISISIQKEFASRGFPVGDKPTYGIGSAYNILTIFCNVPGLKIIAVFPEVVCWIIYWVKVAEYKKRLLQLPAKNEDSLIFGHVQQ